jgi:hypothetical protein
MILAIPPKKMPFRLELGLYLAKWGPIYNPNKVAH